MKGIGRRYKLHIVRMPSFLLAGRKGAIFCGWKFACQSAQQAEEQNVLLSAGKKIEIVAFIIFNSE